MNKKKIILRLSTLIMPIMLFSVLQGCTNKKETSSATDSTSTTEGKVLWEFKAGASILASPVIFEDTIIFGSNDKKMYALDRNTKEEKWTFNSDGFINNTPILDGENLIFSSIASQSTCYSINVKTGKENWHYTSNIAATETLGGWDFHSPSPVLYENSIIFPNKSGNLYKLNKDTGKLEWEYKDTNCSNIVATPGIDNGIITVADVKGNCFAISMNESKTLWSKTVGNYVVQSTAAYNGYAYFAGRDAMVRAFDIKTGTEKWSYSDPASSWFAGDMIIKDDILYVPGSDNQRVIAFKYDTGELSASYIGNGNVFATPNIIDGNIMFAGGDGYHSMYGSVNLFNLETKKRILQKNFDKPIYSSPIEKDGVLYVCSTNGTLYAIDIDG